MVDLHNYLFQLFHTIVYEPQIHKLILESNSYMSKRPQIFWVNHKTLKHYIIQKNISNFISSSLSNEQTILQYDYNVLNNVWGYSIINYVYVDDVLMVKISDALKDRL